MASAIRIEPGVQFEATLVRLFDGDRQGSVEWIRRLAHRASQIFGPRLDLGGVERVAGGADLEDDGVQLELNGPVHDGHKFSLLIGNGKIFAGGPVNVANRGDPGAAEFAGGSGW